MRAVIYTDGACSNNGYEGARAGIGVYWPGLQQNNISEPLYSHPQTNQRAEIIAVRRGIQQADRLGYHELEVRTDSKYVIGAVTEWIPDWERNGWSREVTNKRDFIGLWNLIQDSPMDITFKWVPSDENRADPLAKAGARAQ